MAMDLGASLAKSIFHEKTVIVTGHTGFKGSWLVSWLRILGANVVGIALDPNTSPSHFEEVRSKSQIRDLRIDVRNLAKIKDVFRETQPDFVFHLAAQALVISAYENPIETWETNVLGTVNVLEALRDVESDCTAVFVTSDKCYENVEWIWGYREQDALGGYDPYSATKGAAEFAIRSYARTYFNSNESKVRIASARAGNVIGGGDWAANRIVPDCVRAWSRQEIAILRKPDATRPWQHVLEPLGGYLTLASRLRLDKSLHGEAFNFGPNENGDYSVKKLVEEMSLNWKDSKWKPSEQNNQEVQEAGLLKLNCDKAFGILGWSSTLDFKETAKFTIEWYKNYYLSERDTEEFTNDQIRQFQEISRMRNSKWEL
ncbi:WcaG Nucleoside-diphosphate-sugar epimerases [Candidatus Nanopelagicaceae bacterium]